MTAAVGDFLVTALFYVLLLLPAFIVSGLLEPVMGRSLAHSLGTVVLLLSIFLAAYLGRKHRARKSRHGRD